MAKTAKAICSARTRTILFILLVATVLVGSYALFKMPQIKENFDVVADKKVLLIHAEWCGHCRTLLEKGGAWEQLKTSLPGVTFEALEETNATTEIAKYGVQAFPSIRIVDASGKSLIEYDGARDVASMKAFVMQNVGVVKAAV
jgi:thiol-disulfide isomerase/thioredoxin